MIASDEILNKMNDDAWSWWPFLFLRPAKHEPMTTRIVLTLSVLYGMVAGMLVNILLALADNQLARMPLIFPIGIPVALFLFHRFTFMKAWNRRAQRLIVVAKFQATNE